MKRRDLFKSTAFVATFRAAIGAHAGPKRYAQPPKLGDVPKNAHVFHFDRTAPVRPDIFHGVNVGGKSIWTKVKLKP